MFLVLVAHNIGHGKETDFLFLTSCIDRAIEIAREAEKAGYSFDYAIDGLGVTIYKLRTNKVYGKGLYRDYPIVVHLKKRHGKWIEEWRNEKFEKMFGRKLAPG